MRARRAALLLLAATAACGDQAVTWLDVKVAFASPKVTINRVRLDLFDDGTPLLSDGLAPQSGPDPTLASGEGVAVLLADREAGRSVIVDVSGLENDVLVASGSATVTPLLGQRRDVMVSLDGGPANATLSAVTCDPMTTTVTLNMTAQLAAVAAYDEIDFGQHTTTMQPLTSGVTWSSGTPTIATVDASGVVTGVATGTADIVASFGGLSGHATVMVKAQLTAIAIAPATTTLATGDHVAFSATGTYSDGSSSDVTAQASWRSSDTTILTVGDAVDNKGQVIAVAPGSATLSATLAGVTGMTSVMVKSAVLQSVTLNPMGPVTLSLGQTQPVQATGNYSDNTQQDLTPYCDWKSNNSTTASVGNSGSNKGKVSALLPGNATITATCNAVAAMLQVTVK